MTFLADHGITTPLDGIRVLDLTRVLAGPHCTRMLADLGADVIKVEPPDGDLTRFASPRINGLASYFVQQNAGKRNISLDLSKPGATAILLDLAEHCDVLVENFRPGVMARNGLGYDVVAARNPRIVYASITGYGTTGPWVGRRAYAPVVGAETGMTKSQGDARGGSYANDPHSHADVYTVARDVQRDPRRAGPTPAFGSRPVDRRLDGADDAVRQRARARRAVGRPDRRRTQSVASVPATTSSPPLASGETVIVSGHPAERGTFELFAKALGRTDLIDDPRFVDVRSRLANFAVLRDEILATAATIADAQQFERQFAEHRLAVGVLRSVREVCDTEWARERGVVVEVSDRGGGTIRVPNAPWRFSDAPDVALRGEPRYRGEDNRAVLAELLGLDDAELDRLESTGVLSSRLPKS